MGVAQKYDIYRNVRFNTAAVSVKWDDNSNKWTTGVVVQGSKDAGFGSQYTIYWVIPCLDAQIPVWKRRVFRYLPYIRWRKRAGMMNYRESFHDVIFNNSSTAVQDIEEQSREHLHKQLKDRPDLWTK
jgi:hypothetical protein